MSTLRAHPWFYLLLTCTAVACAWWGYQASIHSPNDWIYFEVGARVLVHFQHQSIYAGNPLHLYADNPDIQIGPPALVLAASLQSLPVETINVTCAMVMALLGVVLVLAIHISGRHLTPLNFVGRRGAIFGLTGSLIVAVWAFDGGAWKHLDDALALALATGAALLIARGEHWYVVAIMLGTAVAAKPWAIILTPMIFGLARIERSRTILLAIAVAGLWWLPFVLAAPGTVQSLGHFMVEVRPGSVLHLFGLRGEVQRWLRPLQFSAGVAGGSWVALRRSWLAAPLAALSVRVATDPYSYSYYGLGPVLFALMWDYTRERPGAIPGFTVSALGVEYLLPIAGVSGDWIGVAKLGWVVAVLVGIWRSTSTFDGSAAAWPKRFARGPVRLAQLADT